MSADPHNNNGTATYTYDAVGNRKTLNSTLPPAGGMTYSYDADDRLGTDTYDNDGNKISSSGTANTYDFENHMVATQLRDHRLRRRRQSSFEDGRRAPNTGSGNLIP